MQQLLENADLSKNEQLRELLDQLIERLAQEGYISPQPPQVTPPPEKTPRGQIGGHQEAQTETPFEITDKTLDFLGFKTLKGLLASLGKSNLCRHDTPDLATPVESC